MEKGRARRMVREIAWLAIAVVIALLLAGETVRRAGGWSIWNGRYVAHEMIWLDLGPQGVEPVEIIDFQHATTMQVALWEWGRTPDASDTIRSGESRFVHTALTQNKTVCHVGWPIRFAEVSASGWPPWKELPATAPPPWCFTEGFVQIGGCVS